MLEELRRLDDQIARVGPAAARRTMADFRRKAKLLERENQHVARIGLPPAPSQARRTRARVMIPVPVLALEQMHHREPRHVAARILTDFDSRFSVANAIDETLRVQSEAQANRAQPEKCPGAEIQSTKIRERQNRRLEPPPRTIRNPVEIRAVMIDRRLARLPQPSQMGPPEAEARARDVFRRVRLRVMQPMGGWPRRRRARSVEHRKENQHAARPRIQLERSMRDRAMVPDRRAEAAEKYQRHGP